MHPVVRIIIAIAITLAAGFLSSTAMGDSMETWYPALNKPSFQPPPWVFAPVWTILYVLMGLAAGLVWSYPEHTGMPFALGIYVGQLLLNATWTVLFFGMREPEFALVEIVMLWIAIVLCIIAFRRVHPPAAWLLVPYLLWVSFAAVLNAFIVILN